MKKSDLEKIKKMTPQALGEWLLVFWNRFFKLFLTLFFLAVAVWCGYLWYFNIYQGQWSEEEKKAFLSSQTKEIEFKKEVLEKVVRRIDASRQKFEQETVSAKNIFRAY